MVMIVTFTMTDYDYDYDYDWLSLFLPRSVPEWKNLPDQARNAASVDSFKSFLTSNVNFEKLLSISHYYD